MEIILSIFLTLEVKSYLILTNFWKIVRILVISEKSDLGTHSAIYTLKSRVFYQCYLVETLSHLNLGTWPLPLTQAPDVKWWQLMYSLRRLGLTSDILINFSVSTDLRNSSRYRKKKFKQYTLYVLSSLTNH